MKIDKQYVAGLFDGEGSVGMWSQGARFSQEYIITCHVGLCNERAIRLIHEMYPEGHVTYIKSKNFWRLGLKGFNCKRFLEDIYPYLIVKKEEVEIALEYLQILQERYEIKNKHSNLTEEEKDQRQIYRNKLRSLKYANR